MLPGSSWLHPESLPWFRFSVTYCHIVPILGFSRRELSFSSSLSLPVTPILCSIRCNYPLDMSCRDLRRSCHHHLHNGAQEENRGKPNKALLLSIALVTSLAYASAAPRRRRWL